MAFPTTGILDDFNRTNEGPPPSADWVTVDNGHKVVSSQLVPNSDAYSESYWNQSFGADMEAYVTIVTKESVGNSIVLQVRTQPADSYKSYYLLVNSLAGTDTILIRYWNGSSGSTLATYNQEISAGDSVGISAIGSTITAWYKASGGSWTELGHVTNTSESRAGYIDIANDSVTPVFDNFGGGTANAAFPTTGILDNFNRANEGPPMTGWTDINAGLEVISNVAGGHDSNNASYYTSSFGANQEAYLTITTVGATGEGVYLTFRDGSYNLNISKSAGTDTWTLWEGDNNLLSGTQEISNGDSIGISAIDSLITCWYKATGGSWVELGHVTNTADLTSGVVGIEVDGTTYRFDDFGGGTVTGGATGIMTTRTHFWGDL